MQTEVDGFWAAGDCAEAFHLISRRCVGIEGKAKRIDVFATALHAGMTVEELQYLDLSYAPPFAPVWDSILIAARKATEQP